MKCEIKFWSLMFLFFISVVFSDLVTQYGNIIFIAGYLFGLFVGYFMRKDVATESKGGCE